VGVGHGWTWLDEAGQPLGLRHLRSCYEVNLSFVIEGKETGDRRWEIGEERRSVKKIT